MDPEGFEELTSARTEEVASLHTEAREIRSLSFPTRLQRHSFHEVSRTAVLRVIEHCEIALTVGCQPTITSCWGDVPSAISRTVTWSLWDFAKQTSHQD